MTEKPAPNLTPPVAEKRPYSFTHHGITVEDPYHWLKDQSYPVVDDADVLGYLKAENSYFEAHMAAQKPLVDTLFEEMKARIKEDDSTVPQKDGDWVYWSEFEAGTQYRKHYRKAADGSGAHQLILDENELAAGKDYFRLGELSVSPNGKLMAYSYDDNGSERFAVHVRNLETGSETGNIIPGTLSSIVWSSNNIGFVYGLANENWRTDNLKYHRLGDDPANDVEIFREADEGFRVDVGLSAQEDYIFFQTGDNETSEIYIVPANDLLSEPMLVKKRKKGVQYSVDIRDNEIFVLTNDDHVNFRIATASLGNPGDWTSLIAGSSSVYLTGFSLFKDFFVTESRIDGLDQVEIRSYNGAAVTDRIKFPEASYDAGLSNNPEYAVTKLRLSYESMVTPDTVYDYHVMKKRLETLKVQEIPSGYDPAEYETERLMITVRDGTQVPVSVLYRKGFKKRDHSLSIFMPMGPMAMPCRRGSARHVSALWIAALPMPSRISAAAMIWAMAGIWTAS